MLRRIALTLLAVVLVSKVGYGQTGLKVPLQVTVIPGISSTWPGEAGAGCSAGVILNQSTVSRRNNYHAVSLTSGSGAWSVTINYSDVSCSGPWSSFGSAAQITQVSNPTIGYGNGYHPWIQVVATGNAVAQYAGQNQLPLSTSVGSVSFPISVAQGGTGFGSCTTNGMVFGGSPLGCTGAGSQYQVFQAGNAGVPSIGALHLDQSAAITGTLPVASGGTGVTQAQGNGSKVQRSTGSPTSGNCTKFDADGNTVDSGSPCNSFSLPTGSQLQYLRLQPNTGNATTAQMATLPTVSSVDYNYPAITPSSPSTLTGGGGAQTITVAMCPLGIYYSSTWAPVELSAGSGGAAEAVTPSGGTCSAATQGITGGTIIVTPLQNHGAGYTITSATVGIQEAAQANPAAAITMPSGNYTLYATATFTSTSSGLFGQGQIATTITSLMTAQDVFVVPYQTTGTFIFQGFTLKTSGAQTAGAGLNFKNVAGGTVRDVTISSPYIGISVQSYNSFVFVEASTILFQYQGITNQFTADPSDGTQLWLTDAHLVGVRSGADIIAGSANIYMIRASLHVKGLITPNSGVQYGILVPAGLNQGVFITDSYMDGYTVAAVFISGALDMVIANNIFEADAGLPGATGANGIIINSSPVAVYSVQIANNHVSFGTTGVGIALNCQGSMNDVVIYANNLEPLGATNGGTGIQVAGAGSLSRLTVGGNKVGAGALSSNTLANYGIIFTLGLPALTNVNVSGNDLYGSSYPLLIDGISSFTNVTITNNNGVDNVIPAVASGATLAFPVNPNFTITGTTPVTAVSGLWKGRKGSFVATDGVLYFVVGATIGNTVAIAQNVPYSYSFDGTKLWIERQSGALVSTDAATNSTSSLGSTALLTAPTPGEYRACWMLTTGSVSGGSATALVTIGWTDAVGAKTLSGAALTLSAAANQSSCVMAKVASGNLTYATTYVAGTGGNYNLSVTAELVK